MYSDRNFNIRREFVDPEDTAIPARVRDPEIDGIILPLIEAFFRIVLWGGVVVVLFFAACMTVAIGTWLYSFTLTSKPQPVTQTLRRVYDDIQEIGRSPARPSGEERSGNSPAPGRTQQHRNPPAGAEAATQNKVVLKEGGTSVPSFQWVCLEGKLFCALKDPNGQWIQSFRVENGQQLLQSGVNPNTIQPKSWHCQTGGPKTKMYCTIQASNGQFLEGILYDGKVMREFKNAETEPMANGVAGDGREFPTIGPGTVQEWGQGGFPRVVTLSWTENLPNGCRRLDVTVPAGETASVFGSTSRGAPLDTIRGPAVFVLRPGQCVVSGTLDVCASGSSGS